MYDRSLGARGAIAVLLIATTAQAQKAPQQPAYIYTTIDPLGSVYTIAYGINGLGQIVGYYQDNNGMQHGFVRNGENYTTFDPPDSDGTIPYDINDSGSIVGIYYAPGTYQLGFLCSGGGYTTIDPAGSNNTQVNGINSMGHVVGSYRDANTGAYHCFLFAGGTWTFRALLIPTVPT
jgi:probable HAF family extracellular repeat protein